MTNKDAHQIIKDAFDSLYRTGILDAEVNVEESTVVLGTGSVLDSIGFVTFITDIEDRINEAAGKEVALVLGEIDEFNVNEQFLTVGKLAEYIAYIVNK